MKYHLTNTDNPIDFPKMPKKLFLITYESADWCGASDTKVVVWAHDKDDAEFIAEDHMSDEMRELFSDEYEEEPELAEETSYYTITSIEEFGRGHEEWKYFQDETQSQFYPVIGEP
jgi:hypothetical protein